MKDYFLIAHIETEKAQFADGEEIAFEIINEIDAWTKMEVHFRHQIRFPRKFRRKNKQDLSPLIYAVRQKAAE
jgi:hypothetical protein